MRSCAHDVQICFGQLAQAVGPEQHAPTGPLAVDRGVATQVTEVDRTLEVDDAVRRHRAFTRPSLDGQVPHREPSGQVALDRQVDPQHGADAQLELGVAAFLLGVDRGEGIERAPFVEVDEPERPGVARRLGPRDEAKDRAEQLRTPAGLGRASSWPCAPRSPDRPARARPEGASRSRTSPVSA